MSLRNLFTNGGDAVGKGGKRSRPRPGHGEILTIVKRLALMTICYRKANCQLKDLCLLCSEEIIMA